MSRLFVHIYDWFERHRVAFYATLVVLVAICVAMASQLSLQENITDIFNSSDKKKAAFENIAVKDKIVVMLSGEDPDAIVHSAELFEAELSPLVESGLVSSVVATADEQTILRTTAFVYDNLPIFLTDADYEALEEKVSTEAINRNVDNAYNLLTSPSGMVVGDVIMKDPLNLGTPLLRKFEQFNPDVQYEIYNGRLFTKDLKMMLMFIQPSNGLGDTGKNDELVSVLERAESCAEVNGVGVECIGGPIIAVYNARQIKRDTNITMSIAMLIILVVIFFSFRNRWSIPLIIVPPLFGALFALAMVWLVQGEMSAIAIGAGTVVMGISLSYSIHIVSHLNHISSPRQIIEELTEPLTIGCFTTIGAFAALMFTSSSLLQDMGLFSLFTLIGTTIFSLVFMPQFLRGFKAGAKTKMLNRIEQAVGYRYDGNKWVVLPILLLTVVALFFYQDAEFDDNMSHINYMPKHIAEADARSKEFIGDDSKSIYIVTGGDNLEAITSEYQQLETLLNDHKSAGAISDVVTVSDFVIPTEVQRERIAKWNKFWSERRDATLAQIDKRAQSLGFKSGAFGQFKELLEKEYSPCTYSKEEIGGVPLVSEWVNVSESGISLLSRIDIDKANKTEVYSSIDKLENSAVVDRGYFSSKMVESTSEDFNYILLVSSLIVFVALLFSYGRLELTLLAFLPMAISWVLILGMMAIFDIKFNIVNIILATFIFGIGDDFSIFIMDGLLQEYRSGKKVLGAHKTAIFFSAFTAIVGMGVLIFAKHPALKSIALISVLGLSVVVLVSYTVQPLLFRLLVTLQTKKAGFPYTIAGILNTMYAFLYFLLGCIVEEVFILVLMAIPMKRSTKKLIFHKIIYWFARIFLATMITVKTVRKNPYKETFDKPAVIIANHQSFIDILLLLSTTPKIVIMTNSWVWNSPFFGWIVRYADFYHAADGYEALAERLKARVDEGYSVVVFPEGTRSADCSILRFHKGAFYLADLLKLDILPMVIYGAGQVSEKTQGFYIKWGIIATKIMKRVKYGDKSFGASYQEQSKRLRSWYIEQYRIFRSELGVASDPYFKDALLKNYVYKGPALERHIRRECRRADNYDMWDRIIPRNATITDLGCDYGQVSFMLGLLSRERKIVAVDCDIEKIEIAEHAFLNQKLNIRFGCADLANVEIEPSDAIILNRGFAALDVEAQKATLTKAVASLNEGGVIVAKAEDCALWADEAWMGEFAKANALELKSHKFGKRNSKTLYTLTKHNL